jgi:D-threo-aldose 1-dehydrogenase
METTSHSELASTGLGATELSSFVLGTSQLGGLYQAVEEETAQQTLQTAWDLGVRRFDTAPHYGTGLSERRVGRFLAGLPRESFTISSKVGRLLVDVDSEAFADPYFVGGEPKARVFDFSRDGILRSVADSLTRLGLDRIDTLYLHDPDDHLDQAINEGYPALAELRDQGVVEKIGAGMINTPGLIRIVAETGVDEIMLAGRYTLMDRSAEDELLPLCQAKGVSVVAVGVYASGILGNPRPGAYYNWAPATEAELAQAYAYRDLCAEYQVPLPAAALQFPLRHPAIASVGIGTRTSEQARQNLGYFTLPIPDELWARL